MPRAGCEGSLARGVVSGCCYALWVDARVWGKSRGLDRRYPLLCHLLDTAAVAGVLWDRVLTEPARRRLAVAVGVEEARLRRLISLWAGLHDVVGTVRVTLFSSAQRRTRQFWCVDQLSSIT
ncbi:HD domain-containing protein [Streptomyces nigrescens]